MFRVTLVTYFCPVLNKPTEANLANEIFKMKYFNISTKYEISTEILVVFPP